jgi:hypothetical protein
MNETDIYLSRYNTSGIRLHFGRLLVRTDFVYDQEALVCWLYEQMATYSSPAPAAM